MFFIIGQVMRRESQVQEWVNKHKDKSALELTQELERLMTGHIGPGGARKGRIMRGEAIVVVQLLHNELVDMGEIKDPKIKPDGVWKEGTTGKAIFKIRELVGTTYSPEERRKLKNKKLEKTMGGYTLNLLEKHLRFISGQPKLVKTRKDRVSDRFQKAVEQGKLKEFVSGLSVGEINGMLISLKRERKTSGREKKHEISLYTDLLVDELSKRKLTPKAFITALGGVAEADRLEEFLDALSIEKLNTTITGLRYAMGNSKGEEREDFRVAKAILEEERGKRTLNAEQIFMTMEHIAFGDGVHEFERFVSGLSTERLKQMISALDGKIKTERDEDKKESLELHRDILQKERKKRKTK